MSIIPLHLQRRFEQRWAARFGPLKRTTPPSGVSSLGDVAYFKLGPQIPSRTLSAQIVPRFKENHRDCWNHSRASDLSSFTRVQEPRLADHPPVAPQVGSSDTSGLGAVRPGAVSA